MSYLVAYVDGSSRSNSRSSGIGVVFEDASGRRVAIAERVPSGDNNYAEYAALLAALKYAASSGCRRLQVFSDSEVVVRQINGQYHCRSRGLRQIYESCKTVIDSLEHFAITHIRREQNRDANQLATAAVERRELSRSAATLAFENC
jgi:ribonuclease HI